MNKKEKAIARQWMKENKNRIPKIKRRPRKLQYVGATQELVEISDNPRQGSHVYIGGTFLIVTGHSHPLLSHRIPGAPTMPIKQWIHRGQTERAAS